MTYISSWCSEGNHSSCRLDLAIRIGHAEITAVDCECACHRIQGDAGLDPELLKKYVDDKS